MRATIRDVAALAGVSIGTASKALNGQGKLRPETRDRVAAAARELDFAPNVLTRGRRRPIAAASLTCHDVSGHTLPPQARNRSPQSCL